MASRETGRGRQVALDQLPAHGQHTGDVVEPVRIGLIDEERSRVHLEARRSRIRVRVFGAIEPVQRAHARVSATPPPPRPSVVSSLSPSPVLAILGRAHRRRHLARAQLARNLLHVSDASPACAMSIRSSASPPVFRRACGRSCSICRGIARSDVATGARRTSDEPVSGGAGACACSAAANECQREPTHRRPLQNSPI